MLEGLVDHTHARIHRAYSGCFGQGKFPLLPYIHKHNLHKSAQRLAMRVPLLVLCNGMAESGNVTRAKGIQIWR